MQKSPLQLRFMHVLFCSTQFTTMSAYIVIKLSLVIHIEIQMHFVPLLTMFFILHLFFSFLEKEGATFWVVNKPYFPSSFKASPSSLTQDMLVVPLLLEHGTSTHFYFLSLHLKFTQLLNSPTLRTLNKKKSETTLSRL